MSTTNFGEYTLISSLLNQVKTNNIIFDIIFGLVVAKVIQNLFSYSIYDIFNNIRTFKNIIFFYKGKIEIICTSNNEDKKFIILQTLDDMIKKNIKESTNIYYDNNGKDFILRGIDKTLLTDNIYISINSQNIDRKKDDMVVARLTIYTVILTSRKLSSIEIEEQLEQWIKTYEKNSYKKPIQITQDIHIAKDFKSFKTFDNLFFDGKELLLKHLDRFKNNEALYKRLGRPYTLGVLLYGEAGCGKTSVLKATANFMNLDIHSINIKNYKNIDDFYDCWYHSLKTNSYRNNSLEEKIIHLPEIDYLCNEFLKDEEKKKNNENDGNDGKDDNKEKNIVINVNKSDVIDNKEKNNGLTKAFFRELFDGVDEQHGRIIIMDSNNPERLDPIMIRDGRIDIKIYFGKMSSHNMKLYLEHVFQQNIDKDITLPDRKFRVSKIQNIIESSINDNKTIYECIEIINNTDPEDKL